MMNRPIIKKDQLLQISNMISTDDLFSKWNRPAILNFRYIMFLAIKTTIKLLNGSQLEKLKKSIPDKYSPCHEIYRDEAVGLKSFKYTEKDDLCEYVEFGGISWKFDIFVNNCLIEARI